MEERLTSSPFLALSRHDQLLPSLDALSTKSMSLSLVVKPRLPRTAELYRMLAGPPMPTLADSRLIDQSQQGNSATAKVNSSPNVPQQGKRRRSTAKLEYVDDGDPETNRPRASIPKRSGAKRSYNESSFQVHGEGYADDSYTDSSSEDDRKGRLASNMKFSESKGMSHTVEMNSVKKVKASPRAGRSKRRKNDSTLELHPSSREERRMENESSSSNPSPTNRFRQRLDRFNELERSAYIEDDENGIESSSIPKSPLNMNPTRTRPVLRSSRDIPQAQFEFGIDPEVDPESTLALHMSYEEEKARERKVRTKEASRGLHRLRKSTHEQARGPSPLRMSYEEEKTRQEQNIQAPRLSQRLIEGVHEQASSPLYVVYTISQDTTAEAELLQISKLSAIEDRRIRFKDKAAPLEPQQQLLQRHRQLFQDAFLSKKQNIINILSNLSGPNDLGDDIQLTKEVVGLHEIAAEFKKELGG
jgi:hypothetical protein